MVVHSPAKFEVVSTAATTVAPALQQPLPQTTSAGHPAPTSVSTSGTGSIPASVLAAAGDGNLLLDADEAWNAGGAHGGAVQRTGRDNLFGANVNSGARFDTGRTGDASTGLDESDRIPAAGSVPGRSAPPPEQLNPFTPAWFAQMIESAVTAAATAVAASSSQRPPSDPSLPRRLNERKIPDFWEDRPEFWFRIFDAHLLHFAPSEQKSFDTLLPLLTPAARAVVHAVIRTPGQSPYTRAREALIRHFGRTPRQLAREMRDARQMGERLPSCLLYTSPSPRDLSTSRMPSSA